MIALDALPVTAMGKIDKLALVPAAAAAARQRSDERSAARQTTSKRGSRDFGNDVDATPSTQETP